VIDNNTKNDITYMTQIQLLFDQERKSTKLGDTELLKRVIRSEDGTLTSYIKMLEAKLNMEFAAPEKKEEVKVELNNFNAFMNQTANNLETPNTLN
jgi:hypothetical protein